MLTRLRWSAFGLRGRIVGAVLVTTAVTLGVAALVLLPQLEKAFKNASEKTLTTEIGSAGSELRSFSRIKYSATYPALTGSSDKQLSSYANAERKKLSAAGNRLQNALGATNVTLVAYINAQGSGTPIDPQNPQNPQEVQDSGLEGSTATMIRQTYREQKDRYIFASYENTPVVSATIWLKPDAVLLVRASIESVPAAVKAVRRAFEIAAAAAILMTFVVAIPLAGTLVNRLRRLRQAALQLAIDGGGRTNFPVDRARDEVGDLARSFAIMQRRLRQQEEARRAFVATASHELRTPLASLDGMLELLADDLSAEGADLQDAAALLDRARAQSRRLGRLAADLLDLSRLDAEVALRSEPIELSELGRAVMAEFELASRERGVKLVLSDGGMPAWALADPGSVARIQRILLDNALRVAPRGSEINILVSADPSPRLRVADGGPGVAPEERAVIFDRFKRGRDTGGEAGFGLGLAIGRELAQRMGGSLTLADTEGPGATFTLALRAAQAPSPDQVVSASGV